MVSRFETTSDVASWACVGVNNVTDKLPNPVQGNFYDPIGRVYRIGLRFNS